MVPFLAAALSLVLLVWSAGRFVEGSAVLARRCGIPPLLIGMVIVGFGTSAPEMAVSAIAARAGNADIALGNPYGSNIANIALILGLSAIVRPIGVHSRVLRKELPVLAGASQLTVGLLLDLSVSRADAAILLSVFSALMVWAVREGVSSRRDALGDAVALGMHEGQASMRRALGWVLAGLVLLIGSSRILVWSAVEIATSLGVSDLVIGLTVVAVGTSLPELASSLIASRKGEDDIALGNILGSNLFNTLAVVGLAAAIRPLDADPSMLTRDLPVMGMLTVALFVIGFGFRKMGRVSRLEGAFLLASYLAYMLWLVAGRGV
jgi:cation:H+ antiporter